MTTTTIILLISAGLFVMVAAAFIMQALEKSAKERKRTEAGLKTRARNFQYMLDSFPPKFLHRELKLLVYTGLLETLHQLAALGRRAEYSANIELATQQLRQLEAQQQEEQPSEQRTNTASMEEIQKLLGLLAHFVERLQQRKRITTAQAKQYGKEIHRLMVTGAVDALQNAAQQALTNNKPRLAIHYQQMAVEKMNKDNEDGQFSTAITELKTHIEHCQKKYLGVAESIALVRAAATNNDEWKEFEQEKEAWKKKVIYD